MFIKLDYILKIVVFEKIKQFYQERVRFKFRKLGYILKNGLQFEKLVRFGKIGLYIEERDYILRNEVYFLENGLFG